MCDVTSVHAVIYHVCIQSYIMEMAKNSDNIADSRGGGPSLRPPKGHSGSMCDVTSVHAARYLKDGEEQ